MNMLTIWLFYLILLRKLSVLRYPAIKLVAQHTFALNPQQTTLVPPLNVFWMFKDPWSSTFHFLVSSIVKIGRTIWCFKPVPDLLWLLCLILYYDKTQSNWIYSSNNLKFSSLWILTFESFALMKVPPDISKLWAFGNIFWLSKYYPRVLWQNWHLTCHHNYQRLLVVCYN